MCHRLYQLHCAVPNLVTFICRKKKVDMRKSIIDQWENEILPYPPNDPRNPCKPYGGHNPSAYIWKNGGVTYCFGIQEVTGMPGAQFDAGYVCQAEQLTESDWEYLAHRCGRAGNWLTPDGVRLGQIWGCANPDVGFHWIPQRVESGDTVMFNVSFRDNILMYQDGAFTPFGSARTEHLGKTLTGIRYRRLFLGEWCSAEGLIFPEFDPDKHVIDKLPDDILDWNIYQGIDYGHSAAFVCAWVAHNPETDEMIGFQEWRYSNMDINDHIAAIFKHSEGMHINLRVSDHDSQMNHQLNKAGLGTENADKEAGSVLRGLDFIRLRLKNGTLKFYKDMLIKRDPILQERNAPKDGIAELALYRHIPIEKHIGDSKVDDMPMKGQSDHYIDCIRYIIDKIDRTPPLMFRTRVANVNRSNWGY